MTQETTAAREATAGPRSPSAVLHGTRVAPGLAVGICHRKDDEPFRSHPQRVPLDSVERELNRFHRALGDSHEQLADLKRRLAGKVPADHVRILDVHVALLKDSVFLSDVENLILNEQMSLEAAIGKVISDFDRIFRLVENEMLRERAVDLRDVGIRVLRNLGLQSEEGRRRDEGPHEYVLVARELSIVDMFDPGNERVLGIVTEEGGLTSHAAILARSMRIPTLTGVDDLLEHVAEGDFLIVDATEGVVRVEPDEMLRAQYRQANSRGEAGPPRALALPLETSDRQRVGVSASCGNLPEVEQAIGAGIERVGLYRTELLYLLGRQEPTLESLAAHYTAVVEEARGGGVTFRLLHADSGLELSYLHEQREPQPALGRAGVRALLEHEEVLRQQLRAICAASRAGELRVAVPFVTDCGELRRVKEILFDERRLAAGGSAAPRIPVGAVIETPAAALGAQALAREADFLVVGLDALQQYLMAADRAQHDLASYFEPLHPITLRVLGEVVRAAEEAGKELTVFGVSAATRTNLPLLLGAGLSEFCVPPAELESFAVLVRATSLAEARSLARAAMRAPSQADLLALTDRLRHGPD